MGSYAGTGTEPVTAGAAEEYPRCPPPGIGGEATVHPDTVFAHALQFQHPVYLWGDGCCEKGRYSVVAHSPRLLVAAEGTGTRLADGERSRWIPDDPLTFCESLLQVPERALPSLPFCGGWIGYIGYEHGCAMAGWPAKTGPVADVQFGLYDRAYVFDHDEQRGYWIGPPEDLSARTIRRPVIRMGLWHPSVDEPTYRRHIGDILEHIAAGDIYQANYTVRHTATGTVDPGALALHVRRELPSPLGAYLSLPGVNIWSLSPERLVSGRKGSYLESRPIKGDPATRCRSPPRMTACVRNW